MSVISKNKKTAIVLFNLGGPDSPEAVKPFLFNLFNDPYIIGAPTPIRYLLAKFISGRRAPIAREIYSHMGGKSPIMPQTELQAKALEEKLKESGDVKTFISMRYWHPMSPEVVAQVKDYDPDHIILLPLYPQLSSATTVSSLENWEQEAKEQGLKKPTSKICCYPTDVGFISAMAKKVQQTYFEASELGTPRVLFSAHGLPEKIINKGDPYQSQVEKTVEAIVKIVAIKGLDYRICYQSRVGPLKWIGPSTDDVIIEACEDRVPIMVVPVAFVSEHSETLVELDIEYRELAEEHDMLAYHRVDTVQDDPHFIEGLANLCLQVTPATDLFVDEKEEMCHKKWKYCPHVKLGCMEGKAA